jgi:hypothetical protein
LLQRQAWIAAETAKQHAAEADQHVGYTEALASNLHKVASIAEKAVDMAQARQAPVQDHVVRAANVAGDCRLAAHQLEHKRRLPINPAPASMCMLLEIEYLVKWEQELKGKSRVFRFATGNMTELQCVQNTLLGFETAFCDGSRGRCKRVPTLLTPARGARSYKYAVWLDQIDCAMVSAQDEKGKQFYMTTNKLFVRG